jgi:ABC-2 type transport system permease protein
MNNFFRTIIRSSAFIRKEIYDILRQPRLVLTLILGPFLILFIFGAGYSNQARPLRAIFVAPQDSDIAQNLHKYEQVMGSQLLDSGVTSDQEEALNRLRRGDVDLVIVVPKDAYSTVLKNQQAQFTMYHAQIDPVQVSYIEYFDIVFVDGVNREMLRSIAELAQKNSTNLHADLQEAHANAGAVRQAIKSGDVNEFQQQQSLLIKNTDAITLAAGTSLVLLNDIQRTSGANGEDQALLLSALQDLQKNSADLKAAGTGGTTDQRLATIDKIDKNITDLDANLTKFQRIDPSIIVNPFRSETKSVATVQPSQSDYFAPAVLALLMQHLAVTFAALSIVRERSSGTMEFFRVSPLSAGEALFGKYLSYLLFGAIIAAILSALLIFGLHMPMLGSWLNFSLVILAVLFTSLSIGFLISIVSQTDSQAVQYSMIILLASVFFGGFMIDLNYLLPSVKVLSWLLPTTYGTSLLREIALKGNSIEWLQFGGLLGIGGVFLVLSWLLLKNLTSASK